MVHTSQGGEALQSSRSGSRRGCTPTSAARGFPPPTPEQGDPECSPPSRSNGAQLPPGDGAEGPRRGGSAWLRPPGEAGEEGEENEEAARAGSPGRSHLFERSMRTPEKSFSPSRNETTRASSMM